MGYGVQVCTNIRIKLNVSQSEILLLIVVSVVVSVDCEVVELPVNLRLHW